MVSIGIDLVEIKRIRESMLRPGFLNKILGEFEYIELQNRKFKTQSVAANFCAKEAFLKAIGKGFGFCKLRDIEILRKLNGKPYLKLNGKAYRFQKENNLYFEISMTHTKDYASAVVVGYRK